MEEEISNISRDIQTNPIVCKICGAPALYKYFGAISCNACKVFFKRNAQKVYTCQYNGNCEININNRHICSLCRLNKCLASGMQIEMIRCPRKINKIKYPRTKRMIKIKQNQSHSIQRSHFSSSELNINQWKLISNLIYCHEDYNIFLDLQQFIREQNNLPIKLRFKHASLHAFFRSVLNRIELFFKLNNSVLSLCRHDCSILRRCIMGNAGCFTAALILNEIPYLDYLGVTESVQNHFQSIFINLTKISSDRIPYDMTFIQLGLAIFIFSTNNCVTYTQIGFDHLKNIKNILNIQDIYTEIAWKYLLCQYDHRQAVLCLTDFIKSLLLVNTVITEIHQSEQYQHLIKQLMGQN